MKNIRRRVYDALNVLMAMDIITKEKKQIWWKGLRDTNAIDREGIKVGRCHYYYFFIHMTHKHVLIYGGALMLILFLILSGSVC